MEAAKCCNHTCSMDAAITYFSPLLQKKFSVAELLQTLPLCTCREALVHSAKTLAWAKQYTLTIPSYQGVEWTCLG